jgi:hypothetical protein
MIDLDDCIFGSQNRFYTKVFQWSFQGALCLMYIAAIN